MKNFKVETLIYYSKLFANRNHIAEASKKGIQEKLDQYAAEGWSLVSTDATQFGAAMYIYLYFVK